MRSIAGLFYFGKIRRSDWLPVGAETMDEQVARGDSSADSSESGRAPSYDEDSDEELMLAMEEDDEATPSDDGNADEPFADLRAEALQDDSDMDDGTEDDSDAMEAVLAGDVEPMAESQSVQALLS